MENEKPNPTASEKIKPSNPKKNSSIKHTSPLLKYEERMSIVRSLSEFHVTDKDFPSLSNAEADDQSSTKQSIIPDSPSYSATLSKSVPIEHSQNEIKNKLRDSSQFTNSNIDRSDDPSVGEKTSTSTPKKKRKRAKKKKKNVTAIPEELTETTDSLVQINLEDIDEYPELSSSSFKCNEVSTLKPEYSRLKIKPDYVTPLKPAPKEVKIPGILNVKTPATTPETKTPGKKYQTPVQINILDVLVVPKKQGEIKAKKASLTFNVKKTKLNLNFKNSPHNVLDSTAPIRKRGKEREKPKKNKLTKLKKIILYERALRKQQAKIILDEMQKHTAAIEEAGNAIVISERNETETLRDETPQNSPDKEIVIVAISEVTDETDILEETITDETDIVEETVTDETVIVGKALAPNSEETNLDLPPGEENIFIQLENESKIDAYGELMICVKKVVHSRKYRDYCYQRVSQEIDSTLEMLLQDLVRFQDRQFQKDPIKAKVRKRMVFGIKEVTKSIKINKIKFVIIAPDVERIASEGGLNDALSNLISLCDDNKIPIVFGLPRRKLGHVCKKPVPVSCIGVISYEGTEESYKKLIDYVTEARESYKTLLVEIEKLITSQIKNYLLSPDLEDKKLQEIKKNIFQQLNI